MNDPASEPDMLPEADVRAMVRLLAEVAVTTGGVIAQKRRLMEGIAQLTGTDYWMWNVGRLDMEKQMPIALSILHNLSERQIALLADEAYRENGGHRAYTRAFIELSRKYPQWTRRMEDLIDLDNVSVKEAFYIHQREVDMAHSLFAFHHVPRQTNMYSGIGLHRSHGRDPYSRREMRIAHILISEVDWLHEYGVPEGEDGHAMAKLPPRSRTVQTLLLEGLSLKRIAYQLGLSEHTVKDHVKRIYKHYDVDSRTALLRRFMVGEIGDMP
jgi:DNA-binding CsgD family transcriptional regulator